MMVMRNRLLAIVISAIESVPIADPVKRALPTDINQDAS